MIDYKFVYTTSVEVCEKLKKLGLQEVYAIDKHHFFLNDKDVDFDNLDIYFTNKLFL